MKKMFRVAMAAGMVFAAASVVFAQEKAEGKEAEKPTESAGGTVTVTEVKGSVEVRPAADQPWTPAAVGMKLTSNWEISTGLRGQAVLRFEDNSEVVVQRLTEMKISEFTRSPDTVKTRLKMKYGAVRVQVKKGTAANDFQVSSPTATASVTGTKIEEMSYYRGLGGKIRMGNEGTAQYKVNPTLSLGPGESSNDKFVDPIVIAKMTAWVPVTFSGVTKEEGQAALWHGTVGAVIWQNLVPTINGGPQNPPPPPLPPPVITTPDNHDHGNGGEVTPW